METRKKLTKRQREIMKIFEESRIPLTPQDAWQICHDQGMSIGLATVYRAVTLMVQEGYLSSIEIAGDTPRYEAASKPHHHHFYCQICKRIYDINECPPKLDNLVPDGFEMVDHTIVIYGFCVDCRTYAAD